MLEKQWQIAKKLSPEAEKQLSKYPVLLQQILFNRGIAEDEAARNFLAALPPEQTDPFLMKDMAAAVDRIEHAIQHKEKIIVYGDYDADGVTATALMMQTLEALNANAAAYIPDRFEEGYGLNKEALRSLKEQGAALVITVDCGIRAVAEAEEAQRLGLDLIITDHHSVGPELPPAVAVINAKQADDEYPDKNLAGVGTAYKLAEALIQKLGSDEIQAERLLDLVALGTVADLVSLVGENRWMVRKGIQLMRRPQRQGLMSLIGVSGLQPAAIGADDIGFRLGPRINAAGRLDSALAAYQLLISTDVFEAGKLAQDLDNRNRERQKMTQDVADKAEELAAIEERNLLFAFDAGFNPGVVGLAASRLAERFYRPAIVGAHEDGLTRASCRSIPEFHITDALQNCAELFENFGGHAAAAGFTIRTEKLDELMQRLEAEADESLGGLELRPSLQADAEVALADLKPELLEQLELLEPSGYGNPQVHFVSRGLQVRSGRAVGRDSSHLKLAVSDGWVTFDAIAFRQGHWADSLPKEIDLLYRFEMNEFNGRKNLQLNVQDIKPAETG